MKKLDISNITGTTGQRVKSGSLEWLQLIPKEIAQQIIKTIIGVDENDTKVKILWGILPSIVSGTYTFRKGAVYYNGEIFTVAAATVTPTGGQVPVLNIVETSQTDSAHDPVILSDGSNVNVHLNRVMQWSAGASGSGIANYGDIIQEYESIVVNNGNTTITGGSASLISGAVELKNLGVRTGYIRASIQLESSSTSITKIEVSLSSLRNIGNNFSSNEFVASYTDGTNTGVCRVTVAGTVLRFQPLNASTFPAFTSGNKFEINALVKMLI